jgi:methionine biosynthesis protein MetW
LHDAYSAGVSVLRRTFLATEDENRRVILETMPRRPGARLLDLGCADGGWTLEVARHVGTSNTHGVETIAAAAVGARARGIDVVEADLSEPLAMYEDGSFDVIHSNQVIEHLRNTDSFMQEIRRLLAPGGYALVSTNNLSSWHNIGSLVLGWQPMPCNVSDWVNLGNPLNVYDDYEHMDRGQTHLRVFTGRALTALANYHGLRAVSERAAGYYPLPPAVARQLARLDRRHGAFLVHRFEHDPAFDGGGPR